jgi:hypothetical protein
MENKNLVKKISKGLSILALSTLIGSGICYAKEMNPSGYAIPDVSQAHKLGNRYEDLTDKIEGKETLFDYYVVKNPREDVEYIQTTVASVKGKTFAYGITTAYKQKGGTVEDFYTIYDEDGDGIFETKYTEYETYNKHVDGSMLPEWVLK